MPGDLSELALIPSPYQNAHSNTVMKSGPKYTLPYALQTLFSSFQMSASFRYKIRID